MFRNQYDWRQRSALTCACALAVLISCICSQRIEAGIIQPSKSSPISLRALLGATEDDSSGGSSTSTSHENEDFSVPDYIYEVDLELELAPLDGQRPESNCSIAGYVYVDANDDGQKGPWDVVFVGAEILAYNEADPDNIYSAFTGNDGMYYLGGLPTGIYTIWQATQPEDFVNGKTTVGVLIDPIGQVVTGDDCGIVDTTHDARIVGIQMPEDNYHGFNYNFAERGLTAGAVSKRLLLSKDPTDPIPEPSSLLLVICGSICAIASFGRSRGRRSAATS